MAPKTDPVDAPEVTAEAAVAVEPIVPTEYEEPDGVVTSVALYVGGVRAFNPGDLVPVGNAAYDEAVAAEKAAKESPSLG